MHSGTSCGQRGIEEGRAQLSCHCWAGWGWGTVATHSSDTVYLSASGSQATLPIRTPCATSLSRRPRFLPRMVSRVPPSKGPLRGSICQETRERSKWGFEAGTLTNGPSRCHMQLGGRATQTHCLEDTGSERAGAASHLAGHRAALRMDVCMTEPTQVRDAIWGSLLRLTAASSQRLGRSTDAHTPARS